MYLKSLSLQNFRNYKKSEFNFVQSAAFVVGENTIGKTNLLEAIYFLSKGRSFKAEKDNEAVSFGEKIARISGEVDDNKLELVITSGEIGSGSPRFKKYLVNGVSKRQIDFTENFPAVLFTPSDLEIIVDSPSLRRNFLDEVLEKSNRDYRFAANQYAKSLRQRNALLENVRETGFRNNKVFEYWDEILIKNGEMITQKRAEFIDYANSVQKDIFDFVLSYDKSVISKERLDQYRKAEEGVGLTLVGPHRDDFFISMFDPPVGGRNTAHNVKLFGSRGQQRLAILQLKIIQLNFVEKMLGIRPILLLDDIFSELDSQYINLVTELIGRQQTIITTTHEEFIPKRLLKDVDVISLDQK